MNQICVLIVEPDEKEALALQQAIADRGYLSRIAPTAKAAIRIVSSEPVGLILLNINLPDLSGKEFLEKVHAGLMRVPVILVTDAMDVKEALAVVRSGAADVWIKPIEASQIALALYEYIECMQVSDVVLASPPMQQTFSLAQRVAATDVTVLISGQSGTGKEVLARYLHGCSPRKNGPFVAINCAAIPENMLEAVLFGYEKGAFTGAYQAHAGKFEQAQGGTLLLDEVSEIEMGLQAKLLRVLQEKEVERVCGNAPIPLNVRVLATTNRTLKEQVRKGEFREDLYYRLNVFPLHMAPLSERREDIVPLANALIKKHGVARPLPVLRQEAKEKLLGHLWPGNVREMENVIQRALILAEGSEIRADDILFDDSALHTSGCQNTDMLQILKNDASSSDGETSALLDKTVKQSEHRVIAEILQQVNGNRRQAAASLGISERTLRYKLSKMRESGFELQAAM